MGFSINDLYNPRYDPDDVERQLADSIIAVPGQDAGYRRELMGRMLELRPELLLAELLKHPSGDVRSFCTKALWEIWYHERGTEACEELRIGVRAMEEERLQHALNLFETTACRYHGWAEPINKMATVHYLLRNPSTSADLCRAVLDLKPFHFGALNGLVYCAIQLKDWKMAAEVLKCYWKLCPHASDAPKLDRIIRENS